MKSVCNSLQQIIGSYMKQTVLIAVILGLCSQVAWGEITDSRADITVSAKVQIVEGANDIWLARIVTKQNDATALAYGIRWLEDNSSSWIPTWSLQLVGAMGFMPAGQVTPITGVGTDLPALKLAQGMPIPGHTYEATLSYAPSRGILAVKLLDTTDSMVVYTNGFQVPIFNGALYGMGGTTTHRYLPMGATWAVGAIESGDFFIEGMHFAGRNDKATIRLNDPAPVPSNQYKLFLGTEGQQTLLATITPSVGEQLVPLPLESLPMGISTLRLDYVEQGEVLLSDTKELQLGNVTFQLEPVVAHRDTGTVEAMVKISSAAPIPDKVSAEIRASLYELVWNEKSRVFNEVPYSSEVNAFNGEVDLSTGLTTIPISLTLPNRQGNWAVSITPKVRPQMVTQVRMAKRLFSTYLPATVDKGESYTLVVFPDTQLFAKSYPAIFSRMTDWVSANAAERNIAAVLHVGDITGGNSPEQWERAYASMSLLHGVVPYVLALGNHDMGVHVSSRYSSLVNDYFPVEKAKEYSNLAGTFEPGLINNHYSLFSIGGTDYLVISLDYGPSNEAVEWANQVVTQYPNHKAIILTHSYTTKTGGLSEGAKEHPIATVPGNSVNTAVQMWEKLISKHANSFMVVSGHTAPDLTIPYRVGKADPGQAVYELLLDLQSQDNGGNGWLGLLTFRPDNTIEAELYSPYLGEYANATDNSGFTSRVVFDLGTGKAKKSQQ